MISERIRALVAELPAVRLLADVGCDHGRIAALALAEGKAERVLLTDISAASLKKAERLLAAEIAAGRARAVCCDGLTGADEPPDACVIAGMGGREMISILSAAPFAPGFLVLSPQKNAEELRDWLVGNGYRIARDYTLREGKYYDVIAAARGRDSLTRAERAFGRTNLAERGEAFLRRTREEFRKTERYLRADRLSEDSRARLNEKMTRLREILQDETR